MASAPSQALPSSTARLRADGADVVAIRIALSRSAARGAAARVACERHRYERIPNPCGRLPPRIPIIAARRPANEQSPRGQATGGTGNDQFAVERLRADCRRLWLSRHAACVTPPQSVLTH